MKDPNSFQLYLRVRDPFDLRLEGVPLLEGCTGGVRRLFVALLTRHDSQVSFAELEKAIFGNEIPRKGRAANVATALKQLREALFPDLPERSVLWTGILQTQDGIETLRLAKPTKSSLRLTLPRGRPEIYVDLWDQATPDSLPLWNVPQPRNDFFSGRNAFLQTLHRALSGSLHKHAITGLGGIGKTQTAVEYAYRYRREYQAILWANAESGETLTQSYLEIANCLRLPETNARDVLATILAVRQWLDTHTGWLLILDNADTLETVRRFLPRDPQCPILLTSRAARLDLLGISRPMPLPLLTPEEAQELLIQHGWQEPYTLSEEERAAARLLAQHLGYLPLAIEQVRAFLSAHLLHFTEGLELLQSQGLQCLQQQPPVTGDYSLTLHTTWDLSLNALRTESEATIELLHASAFWGADDIPFELIAAGANALGPAVKAALSSGKATVHDLLEPLVRYSLIQKNNATQTYSLHRLVQEAVRAGLDEAAKRTYTLCAISALCAAQTGFAPQDWPRSARLLPHRYSCLTFIREYHLYTHEVTTMLSQLSFYLIQQGRFQEALPIQEYIVEIAENHFPPEEWSPYNFTALAAILEQFKEDDRALECYRQALTVVQNAECPQHMIQAGVFRSIARILISRTERKQAEDLLLQALRLEEQHLEDPTCYIVLTLLTLTEFYCEQGRYGESEAVTQRAYTLAQRLYGEQDPQTAECLHKLGIVFSHQKRWEESEDAFQQALTLRKLLLGAEHYQTANTLHGLARLYAQRGRIAEAKEFFTAALATLTASLGSSHPAVSSAYEEYQNLFQV